METDKSLKLIKPQKVVKISFNKLLFIDQELYDNIDALPNILKYRIYIMKVREFWKNYVPLTAQIPLWYPRYSKQTNLLLDCQLKNIHFSHLPCNTLESNKKYICGCQCPYCSEFDEDFKMITCINNTVLNIKDIPCTESKWNNDGVFNPLYDLANYKRLIDYEPLYFSSIWSQL
uniref:Uncharacterized protein n=1 Tax=viral metagenome TaxID=1070528 RepID=A0A6C0CFV1_9ZZZZ